MMDEEFDIQLLLDFSLSVYEISDHQRPALYQWH